MEDFMETIYDFTLPKGYVDNSGLVHKKGRMRLATAGDEISATRDPRVLSNPSYLTIVILSKVIVDMEGLEVITPSHIERLFTADLAFLQDMYQRINDIEPPKREHSSEALKELNIILNQLEYTVDGKNEKDE